VQFLAFSTSPVNRGSLDAVLADLEPFATSAAGCAFAVLLGLLWGSFANVCIYRLPLRRSVVTPGSHCFACKTPIRWYDNVPLLAYVWLRGRCRACGASFSPRYLLVEAVTGALFGVAWWFTIGTGGALFAPFDERLVRFAIYAAFVVVMIVIAFIDLDTMEIYDRVSIPSIVVFYALSLVLPERRWYDGLIGAAVGYGVPWLIGEIYFRIRKVEGLGLGDSKLLAIVGALLGWHGVVVSLFGGSVVGSIIGIAALSLRRKQAPKSDDGEPQPSLLRTELPFGPFLALAAIFALFAEPWIELHFRLAYG
jgi:leader peptidase (prepilin peptidase)/N-methyltransferase